MYANAVGAYETVSKMTMSGRETEAAVLTKAARKLKSVRNNGIPTIGTTCWKRLSNLINASGVFFRVSSHMIR